MVLYGVIINGRTDVSEAASEAKAVSNTVWKNHGGERSPERAKQYLAGIREMRGNRTLQDFLRAEVYEFHHLDKSETVHANGVPFGRGFKELIECGLLAQDIATVRDGDIGNYEKYIGIAKRLIEMAQERR